MQSTEAHVAFGTHIVCACLQPRQAVVVRGETFGIRVCCPQGGYQRFQLGPGPCTCVDVWLCVCVWLCVALCGCVLPSLDVAALSVSGGEWHPCHNRDLHCRRFCAVSSVVEPPVRAIDIVVAASCRMTSTVVCRAQDVVNAIKEQGNQDIRLSIDTGSGYPQGLFFEPEFSALPCTYVLVLESVSNEARLNRLTCAVPRR